MRRLADEAAILLLAVQFLTRLPLPADVGWSAARMAATPRHYPTVGLLLGAGQGAVGAAALWVWPPVVAVALVTVAGLLATGAFHEDGLADSFDGLGGTTPEASLEVMRDSRLGTYGALALIVGLGLRVAALTGIAASGAAALAVALVAGQTASRLSAVAAMSGGRYLRAHGTGKPVAAGIGARGLAFAAAIGAVALIPLAVVTDPGAVLAAVAGLALGHWLARRLFHRRLGGYTGDTLGAVQQTSEIGLCLGLLAWL